MFSIRQSTEAVNSNHPNRSTSSMRFATSTSPMRRDARTALASSGSKVLHNSTTIDPFRRSISRMNSTCPASPSNRYKNCLHSIQTKSDSLLRQKSLKPSINRLLVNPSSSTDLRRFSPKNWKFRYLSQLPWRTLRKHTRFSLWKKSQDLRKAQ